MRLEATETHKCAHLPESEDSGQDSCLAVLKKIHIEKVMNLSSVSPEDRAKANR